MKSHINVTSNQGMHKSTKIGNIPSSFTHIVMHIMPVIYMTDSQLHKQFIYSVLPSYTDITRNNLKPQDAVPMQKQKQYTQER